MPTPRAWAPVMLLLVSMTSVQVGAAVSVPLFDSLGVAGTTWLRLLVASVVLLVVSRPAGMGRAAVVAAAVLGVLMAANSVLFAAATARIPLGVTVALEFCGPLTVAAVGARGGGPRRLVWPGIALAGVLALTRPWSLTGGGAAGTWIGLGCAALAGLGWAGYIVLVAHVGRRSPGMAGLAVALTAAALALAPLGAPQVWPAVRAGDGAVLARCVAAALLVPLLPYALEMRVLRRLDQAVFGVWMALEPAIGALVGLVALGQRPVAVQLAGLALVVAAGVGAQRAAPSAAAPPLSEAAPAR